MMEQSELNSKSIISLTLGIISLLIPFLGVISGIAGIVVSTQSLKEIGRTTETGKGLTISGLICSITGIIIQLFVVLAFVTFSRLVS